MFTSRELVPTCIRVHLLHSVLLIHLLDSPEKREGIDNSRTSASYNIISVWLANDNDITRSRFHRLDYTDIYFLIYYFFFFSNNRQRCNCISLKIIKENRMSSSHFCVTYGGRFFVFLEGGLALIRYYTLYSRCFNARYVASFQSREDERM